MIIFLCLLSIYQFIVDVKLCGQKSEQPQKIYFYDLSKINIYAVSKYKIVLLAVYLNLLSYKALSGNTI